MLQCLTRLNGIKNYLNLSFGDAEGIFICGLRYKKLLDGCFSNFSMKVSANFLDI